MRTHDKDCWRRHELCALQAARDVELSAREHHAGQARRLGEAVALASRPGGPKSTEQQAKVYAAVEVACRRLAARFADDR